MALEMERKFRRHVWFLTSGSGIYVSEFIFFVIVISGAENNRPLQRHLSPVNVTRFHRSHSPAARGVWSRLTSQTEGSEVNDIKCGYQRGYVWLWPRVGDSGGQTDLTCRVQRHPGGAMVTVETSSAIFKTVWMIKSFFYMDFFWQNKQINRKQKHLNFILLHSCIFYTYTCIFFILFFYFIGIFYFFFFFFYLNKVGRLKRDRMVKTDGQNDPDDILKVIFSDLSKLNS